MGNIKVKDKDGNWKVVSSSDAAGISVTDPILQKGDVSTPTSAQDVLKDHEDKINTLQRNVSWLAKNGGGGNGGSGGGVAGPSISEATTKIMVNNLDSGSTVLLDESGLIIQFNEMSVQANKNWRVNVSIGSTVVSSGVVSFTNNVMRVTANIIIPRLINHSGILTVSAIYEDDINSLYGSATWSGSILEATVTLAADDVSINLNEAGEPSEDKDIIYRYSTGIIGNYQLVVKSILNGTIIKTTTKNLNIINTEEFNYSINTKELIPNPNPGSYTIETILVNVENASISKTLVSSINYISKNLIIVSTAMSEKESEAVEISVSGSINLNWYVVGQGLTGFNYDYLQGSTELKKGGVGNIGVVINDFIPCGTRWSVGQTVPITIKVYAGDRTTIKTFYFKITKATGDFIKHQDNVIAHTILDFKAKDYNNGTINFALSNTEFNDGTGKTAITNNMTMINSSNLVGIKSGNNVPPSLRFSNGSYMSLGAFRYNNTNRTLHQILDAQDYRFSMNICFKADYHPDNQRTIFSVASLDNNTGNPQNAIEIDVHAVYINGKEVLQLIDNVVNDISITLTRAEVTYVDNNGNHTTLPSWVAKVYLDGVQSAIETLQTKPRFEDTIYLAGKKYTTGTEGDWLCDCNIYAFSMYNKTLNDEDVFVNYTNNKVLTQYVNSNFDFSIITSELRKSFCELSTSNTITNRIYDRNSDSYNINMLLDGNQRLDQDSLNQYASVLGIPIVLIDVSTISAWTFDAFTLQQSAGDVSLSAATGQIVQYYDPTGTNSRVLTINDCTIELQGTSTLADAVKNINITIPASKEDATIFIPKETWLPEQTYTLKADVVDSSHSNNAAIGKFINEVIGDFFPYSPDAQANIENSEYVKKQQPTATLKHTVEGFPVLLIMKFHVAKVGDVSVTPLGIYNFNLGRDAYRNLGFKKVNTIHDNSGSLINVGSFPHLTEHARVDETDSNANWIEVKDTYSVKDLSKITTNVLPSDFNSSTGDFWQNDTNILNLLYEVRYGSRPNPGDYQNFKDFVEFIMALPIESPFKVIDRIGTKEIAEISGDYDAYTYLNGEYQKLGSKHQMTLDSNSLPDVPFNILSLYRYFVIANLFGLADNFGKNSTYRSWNDGNYFIGFYDMDTALGGDNQGELTINPDMWNKYFANQTANKRYGWLMESYADANDNNLVLGGGGISARANKIWLSIDTNTARNKFDMNQGGEPVAPIQSQYAYQYQLLRQYLHNKALEKGYANFAEYFIDEYYSKQCGDCGPLLFNLDYRLKYLLQFKTNTYENIAFASKLHGRKAAYTKNWLNNRITFLDSWFGAKRSTQNYGVPNDFESSADIKTYNTPESIPVVFNTPLIFNFKVGDASKSFYYAPANNPVYIDAGNNSSGSVLTGAVNNSPQLLSIGDEEVPLSDMEINLMNKSNNANNLNEQGYPSFTALDLAGSKKLSPMFSLDSFKPAGQGVSELRELDFSNAECVNATQSFSLVLYDELTGGVQNSKFEKLRKVDIHNSKCISNIKIPAIPLRELNITNSKLIELQLHNQNYLEYIDITGCTILNKIDIQNCQLYSHFEIQNHNNINEINIFNNPNITSVVINNCANLKKVSIQNCPKLTTIKITNCQGLIGTDSVNNYLTLISNTALTSLQLNNNTNLETIYISDCNQANISTLYLHYTKIKTISGDSAEITYNSKSILDISKFSNLSNFTIYNNAEVVQIQFANNSSRAIPLTYCMQRCSKLERIYGYVSLNNQSGTLDGNGFFRGLTNFSIHGYHQYMQSPADSKWHGSSVYRNASNYEVRTPWEILSNKNETVDVDTTTYDSVTFDSSIVSGKHVTNIRFGSNIAMNEMFMNCKLTTFDIYYILFSFALTHTSNSNLYRTFYSLSGNVVSGITFKAFAHASQSGITANNPLARTMFYKCSNITAFNRTFEGTFMSIPFAQSPKFTITDDNKLTILIDNGTWSPLVNNTNFYVMSWRGSVYQFCRKSGNYKITSMNENTCTIVEDDEHYNTAAKWNSNYSNASYMALPRRGDFTHFFDNLPNISSIRRTNFGMLRVDTLKLPTSIVNFGDTFNDLLTGTIDLQKIFAGCNKLTYLVHCFSGSTNATFGNRAEMPYTDDMFKEIPALVHYGAERSAYDWNAEKGVGNVARKYINQNSFPYNILSNTPNIAEVQRLFSDIEAKEIANVKLPGTLFSNTSHITNITQCFKNFHIPYKLSSGGFAKCTGLKYAYQVFGYDVTSSNKPALTGEIPYKLFFHGDTAHTTTYKGVTLADYATLEQQCTYNLNEGKTDLNGNALPANNVVDFTRAESITKINAKLKTYNNTAKVVNRNISDLRYAFYGNVFISRYQNTDDIEGKEINPDYVGTEIKKIWDASTKSFKDIASYQTIQYIDWSYTGNPADKVTDGSIYYFDTENATVIANPISANKNYVEYLAPGDLLRYSTNDVLVDHMFYRCGIVHRTDDIGQSGDEYTSFGITGRICPYMFKNNPSVTNISGLFQWCRCLAHYQVENAVYEIPNDFFSYIPNVSNVDSAFKGHYFPANINLAVFSPIKTTINVNNIFAASLYQSSTSGVYVIQGIFSNNTILYATGAFATIDVAINSDNLNTGSNARITWSWPTSEVKFLNNFNAGRFNNKDNASYVYYNRTKGTGADDSAIPDKNNNYNKA